MDHHEISQDAMSTEATTSRTFTFSSPSILLAPPKVENFDQDSDHGFDASSNKNDEFTFAMPTTISQSNFLEESTCPSNMSEKQLKSMIYRIRRNAFKPPASVFAQAIKDTAMFEQLKKNSRTHSAKISTENSITCTNVPESLLTKAAAKEYFTAFGHCLKITIRRKKQITTVFYGTKEQATVAYHNSGEYKGEKFNVEWTKSCVVPKSPTKKEDSQKHIVTNFLKAPDDEIKSELDALISLEYNLHSDNKDSQGIPVKKNRTVQSKTASKSTRTEKAIQKTEKHKSDSQISDLVPSTSVEELQRIILQAAFSSEDKFKVLEARDRLMRLKQVKSHSLAAAKVMTGTCPDMCPEKERLMREAKRQVALYEQLEGNEYGINHSIAVKQYSRSSADQEEPMGHDLRPVKSLKMTMSYLLHEIANLCDQPGTNLGEWYHFLWDRTRGIRKDITQQELCCTDSVELVEQCARFHIVCSERLCAEELSVFDKKINSDNLTKCLQSLKYMYHDLRVKGIVCKNEPEFRAYIILLNLNNGNFMWDLQRLPPSVQKSPEVHFAVAVYSALESNNYYKFFMLVRNTTYLNACILLRYFNQVRLKALSVMVKAYCRTMSTAYPLYELIDILGFEDENEAISFCEQVGLNASRDELHVSLNRQNFTMPVLNLKQNRACNMIESKRTSQNLSIGECIAGGKMPEKTYKYHKPHNSFDAYGHLLQESVNAADQTIGSSKQDDPYEFIEEDETTSKESVWMSENTQIKTETPNVIVQKNLFKPITTSEASVNVFGIGKPETTFTFTPKPSVQSTSNNTAQATTVPKSLMEKQPEIKSTNIFGMKQGTSVLPTSKFSEPATFGTAISTKPIASQSTNVFSKQFEVLPRDETASPFAMATNKSIFSGKAQGNIFARSTTASTIFSSQSSVQTAPKSSITSTSTAVTDSQIKVAPNFPVVKEPSQTDKTVHTDVEKLKFAELERARKVQQMNSDAEKIYNDLQADVIQEYCSDIVKEDIDRINMWDTLSKEINDQIFDEVMHEMCDGILRKEIINKQKLHEMSIKIKNRSILKYFNLWKQYISKKKQQRAALDCTPVWLQRHSLNECAKLLYSKEQDVAIKHMCNKQTEQEVTKSQIHSLAPIEAIIYVGIKENLNSLGMNMYPNLYWKLIISWPDLHNQIVLRHHKKIMNGYLYPDGYTTEPNIKLYQPNQMETVHICIRNFEGFISDYMLIGSDALLFIASASEDIKIINRRLTKTVLSRHKLLPIPLVFIVLGDGDLDSQNKEILSDLEALLESGYLSKYTIMFERHLTENSILNLTQSAILWLSVNKSPQNPLEMDYLQDVFDTCLTEELWLRIIDDSSFNTKLLYALKEPNFIIDLHNEAVSHIMDILLDPESFMYTKFAPEFKKFVKNHYMMPCSHEYFDDKWKGADYKAKLEKVMSRFLLPPWKYSWPESDANNVHQDITRYCQESLAGDSNSMSSNIFSNLFLTTGMTTMSNFIDTILYIVKQKIRFLDEDLKVIYNRNHIKHFRTLPWWFKSSLLTEYKVPPNVFQTIASENSEIQPIIKKQKLQNSFENEFEDESSLSEFEPLSAFCDDTRNQIMKVQLTTREIEEQLTAQKQRNVSFEERLRNALFDDTEFTEGT